MGLDITEKIFGGLIVTSGLTSLISLGISAKETIESINSTSSNPSNALPYLIATLASTGTCLMATCLYNLASRDNYEISRRNRP